MTLPTMHTITVVGRSEISIPSESTRKDDNVSIISHIDASMLVNDREKRKRSASSNHSKGKDAELHTDEWKNEQVRDDTMNIYKHIYHICLLFS